jgi:4-oxalocrotonate tautomerase
MPHVSIKLYPGRTEAQKLRLAERIVSAMGETIKAQPETISISFEEVSAEDWDEQVVKHDIADKLDCVVKLPGYRSKYLEQWKTGEKGNG